MSNMQEIPGFDLRSYLDQIVQDPLEKFKGFITWTEKDKKEFRALLDELKKPFDIKQETTKVSYIIKRTPTIICGGVFLILLTCGWWSTFI